MQQEHAVLLRGCRNRQLYAGRLTWGVWSHADCGTFSTFEVVGLTAETLADLAAGKSAPLGGTEVAPERLFCISRSFLIAALAAVAAWRGTLVLFIGMSGVPNAASSKLNRDCTH